VLRLAAEAGGRTTRSARPERWGRFEGIQLAFSRFPGFEVHDHALRWMFASSEAAWQALAAPGGPLAGAAEPSRDSSDRLRRRGLELLARSARPETDGLVIDVAYVIVVARKPDWATPPGAGGWLNRRARPAGPFLRKGTASPKKRCKACTWAAMASHVPAGRL
jgi:hypothetical protein